MTKQNKIHKFKVEIEESYKSVARYGPDHSAPSKFRRTRARARYNAAMKRWKREIRRY